MRPTVDSGDVADSLARSGIVQGVAPDAVAALVGRLQPVDFPKGHSLPEELAQQNNRLQDKYAIEGFPTVLFLDGKGEKLGELGYEAGGAANWVKKAQAIIEQRAR